MSTLVTIATQLLPGWYEEWLDPDLVEELENSYPDLIDVEYDDLAEKHTVNSDGEIATISLTSILQKIYHNLMKGKNV